MQKIRFLFLICISAILVACGGGSDQPATATPETTAPAASPAETPAAPAAAPPPVATPSFAGNYSVSLSITSNPCNAAVPQNTGTNQTVTQTERSITLVSGTTTFNGSIDGDNGGISTSHSRTDANGVLVVSNMGYRSTATAGVYSAQYSITASQSGASCNVSYAGTATRN